jgi:ribonuclease D
MHEPAPSTLITDADRVAEIARAIAEAGSFALDLEFRSEHRYVPDLALVQVGWGDPDAPEVAAIDPLAVDPRPVFEVVADPSVETLVHAARQDLGLLAHSYGIEARGLVDTQIAAAFAGMADQIGYGKMVQQLLGLPIDKGSQHTDWTRRPLSERQVAYALDDVRHLPAVWRMLRERLDAAGRTAWAREESARLAAATARRRPPEEAYRSIGGWNALRGATLGALQSLAAWREREALSSNTPPSWLVPDPALLELARRPPRAAADVARVRGVPAAVARAHGPALMAALEAAAGSEPPPAAPRPPGAAEQAQGAIVLAIVQARCSAADLPVRLCGGRSDAEDLVGWFAGGAPEASRDEVALACGWRFELAGAAALAWLRGETSLAASPGGGVLIEPRVPVS